MKVKFYKLTLAILLCSVLTAACKQATDDLPELNTATGAIAGRITVDGSNTGNSGFFVYVGGTSYNAKTGRNGNFKITNIEEGSDYEIYVEKGSFSYYWTTAEVVNATTTDLGTINFTSSQINSAAGSSGSAAPASPSNNNNLGIQIFNITYQVNGGTLPQDYPTKHINGTCTILPEPQKSGYSFGGWHLQQDLADDKMFNLSKTLSGDVTLYAEWQQYVNFSTATTDKEDFAAYLQSYSEDHLTVSITEKYPDLNQIVDVINQLENKYITLDISQTRLTSIDGEQFRNVTKLENVILPENLTQISTQAFSGCSSLTGIVIPDTVTSIGNKAFKDCKNIKSLELPDSITSVGNSILDGCDNLEELILSDNVKYNFIEKYKEYITEFSISTGTTEITDNYFVGYTNLRKVIIPDTVTIIGDCAFSGCEKLTSIIIPESVTEIRSNVFARCSSLTNITIPESVTEIGFSAFSYCSSLTSITIPKSVKSIESSAFYECNNLNIIYYTGSEEDWNNISINYGNEALKSATIIYNYVPPASN